jgi:hypothetical protein
MSGFKTPAPAGQISPAIAGPITDDVVATVLDIIVAAWPHVCAAGISHATTEDDITNKLRWAMVGEKSRRNPPPQVRFERETQRDDPAGTYPTGLIDIFVAYTNDETVYFAIECKKVNDRHKIPAKRYIEKGVCRFSSGKYSPNHRYGAMVGYVTEGTPESAAKFLGEKLIAFDKRATRLVVEWGWKRESRFGAVANLHSTQHRQDKTKNTILLVHLFLAIPVRN